MQELGRVLSVSGEQAKVLIRRHAACGDCGACQVGKEKMTMETNAKNMIDAKPGEDVIVEMRFMNVIEATAIAYGIPLLAFLVGAFIGWFIAPGIHVDQTLMAFIVAVVCTFLAYLVIYLMERKNAFNKKYRPVITQYARDYTYQNSDEKDNE